MPQRREGAELVRSVDSRALDGFYARDFDFRQGRPLDERVPGVAAVIDDIVEDLKIRFDTAAFHSAAR